jgi:leucine dehydrogenase
MEIYNTIYDICDRSKKLNAPTYKVADIIVEEKLANAAKK